MNIYKDFQDNVQTNLDALKKIKENNPSATHVYLRRVNKDNLVVDVPIDQAEMTIRRNTSWILVASNKQMDDAVEALFLAEEPPEDADIVLPSKPSEEAAIATDETEDIPKPKAKRVYKRKAKSNATE